MYCDSYMLPSRLIRDYKKLIRYLISRWCILHNKQVRSNKAEVLAHPPRTLHPTCVALPLFFYLKPQYLDNTFEERGLYDCYRTSKKIKVRRWPEAHFSLFMRYLYVCLEVFPRQVTRSSSSANLPTALPRFRVVELFCEFEERYSRHMIPLWLRRPTHC